MEKDLSGVFRQLRLTHGASLRTRLWMKSCGSAGATTLSTCLALFYRTLHGAEVSRSETEHMQPTTFGWDDITQRNDIHFHAAASRLKPCQQVGVDLRNRPATPIRVPRASTTGRIGRIPPTTRHH